MELLELELQQKESMTLTLAIIDKRRPAPNLVKVMNVIGDVSGRTCIIVDDMVDTAGTLCQASDILKEKGAIKLLLMQHMQSFLEQLLKI